MVVTAAVALAINFVVMRMLLGVKTWRTVVALLALAIAFPLLMPLLAAALFADLPTVGTKFPILITYGYTGQVLMFFLRNLLLVKTREARAAAFGKKLPPSQGFKKDFLLHIPEMRIEAFVVFFLITAVELFMLFVGVK